ncbi:MAG: glycosyl hydrolase family 18 protein [Bacteroidia bacterium]
MKRLIVHCLVILVPCLGLGQSFKVVGYLPYYRFSLAGQIDYEKLTHLNLAFLNPDAQGNLDIGGQNITPIVTQAKIANPAIQVMISLAGGGVTSAWQAAYDQLMLPANRSAFVHSLTQYVITHGLDGLDVDLEWNSVNSLYSPFVLELADSLHAHGKVITAALPATYRYPDITPAALNAFDFINLMAYDLTGPWAPNNPGQHSPFSFAQQGISYWFSQGLPYEKMTLGVPFYGYDFTSSSNVTSFTFATMVNEDTTYAWLDQVGQRYYNGITTIRAKTDLALSQVSGIMIWELGQDVLGANDQYSLLNAIHSKTQPQRIENNILANVQFAPNPFSDYIHLLYTGTPEKADFILRDLQGREVYKETILLQDHTQFNISGILPSGVYLASLQTSNAIYRQKLMRI